jgi:fimbrial isopeptide formation D2 family protein/LPXTG-motif cell wall-anchored protein
MKKERMTQRMKTMKKVLALALAAIMVMALAGTALAGSTATTGSITVTPPANTTDEATNTYTLYRVFNAESSGDTYSYHLAGDHTTAPAGFILDDAGNVYFADTSSEGTEGAFAVMVGGTLTYIKNKTELSATDIANIAAYVTNADIVDTKEVTGTNPAVFSGLSYGYYYVKSTVGSLVVIDSIQPDVEITDKNTVPELDKKAKQAADPTYMELDEAGQKAIAQVGTVVPFEATIKVGKGAINYKFHDKMTAGLTYNNDVAVSASPAVTITDWYTVLTTPDSGDTITITFKDGIPENTVITITYSATITSDALSTDPATNTATIDYGNSDGHNTTPPEVVEVYDAKFTVTKKDGKGQALEGAGFVVKNADGKYYKLADDKKSVSWVDSIADATEYTSTSTGAVPAFTGLGKGTYTLVEKTVPTGYNKAADSTFEIKGDDYTADNLEQKSDVVNNAGTELPSTGGIGTTIFYIVGAILVLGAGAVLVARRKASAK